MDLREFYINDDGIRLHAKLDFPKNMEEKCPLAILVHGFTGHMEERHILGVKDTFLSCGVAVLRAEMYGHGQSDGLFENHTLFKWISNIMAVTDYAKSLDFVTDLYICGHSQGGLLAALAGGMRPDDYKAVLPLSPALFIPDGARAGCLLGRSLDPDHIPEYVEFDNRRLNAGYVRAAQMLYPEKTYPKYKGKVLLVHGTADQSVPVDVSIQAAKLYDHAKLVMIDGDSHCFDHHLEQMLEAVREFIASFQ